MRFKAAHSIFAAVLLICCAVSAVSRGSGKSAAAAVPKELFGRWDLTLKAADKEYPSWLELSEENGQLKAQYVGRWGNARPLPKAEFSNGHLTFVSPKEEEDSKADLVFEGR